MADRQTAMVAVNLQTIRHTTGGGYGIRGRNCPFLLDCSTMPTHYSTPPLRPRKSYSNPRIPGGICSIHENEIPGRRAKGTFERICGIRSRHPMSHCAVVTSSPFDKLPFCPFRFETRFRTRLASRPGQQTARPVPRDFQWFSLISSASRRIGSRRVHERSFHRDHRTSRETLRRDFVRRSPNVSFYLERCCGAARHRLRTTDSWTDRSTDRTDPFR